MKRITECLGNPGNGIGLGVTNHYTPIDNIIINVRNFFGSMLGLYVQKAEDGVSLKITSSQFSDIHRTQDIINKSSFDGHTCLGPYIMSLGLPVMKIIEVGGYCIVYFCPNDMPSIANPDFGKKKAAPVKEMKESLIIEAELTGNDVDNDTLDNNDKNDNKIGDNNDTKVYKGTSSDEVELEDKTHEEIVNIIQKQNKIEAAADLEKILKSKTEFPENVYIKATKDIEGHESIALRWKFEKKRPFGGKIEQAVSLLNIYNAGANAIWVGAFDDTFGKIPEEVEQFIYNLLDIIGANKTAAVEIYDVPENAEDIKKEEKNDNRIDKEDKKDDKEDDDESKKGDENNNEKKNADKDNEKE